MPATIRAIEYFLPETVLTNKELAALYPDWPAEKILAKTGIENRRIAAADQFSSDLAVEAAQKLFESGAVHASEVDFILLVTQSPDYFLPTTACLIQNRLGIPKTAGAFDINLGCSGYVYGLSVAKGLLETNQCNRVLLITAETYSKFIDPESHSVRTIFGDAAAATLITNERDGDSIGPFIFGTDGGGAENLIVRRGGLRGSRIVEDEYPESTLPQSLFMNGPEIFAFTLRAIPSAINGLLEKSGKSMDDIDLFIFHQANAFMLEHLRKRIGIPEERFLVEMKDCGNTVSSTIPVALKQAHESGRLKRGQLLMLVGFGVGYSWGANLIRWPGLHSSD